MPANLFPRNRVYVVRQVLYLFFYTMSNYSSNPSVKKLDRAISHVNNLIQATAEMSASLIITADACNCGALPSEKQIFFELNNLFEAATNLLYQEQAQLKMARIKKVFEEKTMAYLQQEHEENHITTPVITVPSTMNVL